MPCFPVAPYYIVALFLFSFAAQVDRSLSEAAPISSKVTPDVLPPPISTIEVTDHQIEMSLSQAMPLSQQMPARSSLRRNPSRGNNSVLPSATQDSLLGTDEDASQLSAAVPLSQSLHLQSQSSSSLQSAAVSNPKKRAAPLASLRRVIDSSDDEDAPFNQYM